MSTNVDTYPKFKKVSPEDKSTFDNYLELPLYSDFSLLSLLCWDAAGISSYSILNGNLVIKIKDYLTEDFIFAILGDNKIVESVEEILKITPKLRLIPQEIADVLDGSKFNIQEDRDSFDYIIDIPKLRELEGGQYKSLRRHINKFQETYPDYSIKILDCSKTEDSNLIMGLTKEWCQEKNFDDTKTAEDVDSIKKFIDYSKWFETVAIGLFVNKKLVAFTLNEIPKSGWAMGHFGHALHSFSKSSYFIEYAGMDIFDSLGCRLLNLQQDTGILGLREAKMEYQPVYFLKKYTVNPL